MSFLDDENPENKVYTQKYRQLLKACPPGLSKEDRKMIRKAFFLAIEAHKGMRRKSGEPYVYHPIEVATITARNIGLGATSVISALLHDIVEDTDYTVDDIRSMFGEKIARIVDGLTKISGIFGSEKTNKSIQAENFKKVLLTLSEDVRVILIKLADRLHNMRTLDSLPNEKQVRIASETSYLYAPLAHRLGLYSIKSEMEDLVLKYTEPEVYNSIHQKISETEIERKRFINQFIFPIKQSLTKNNIRFSIIGRMKSISSIWNKMKTKHVPFEEIYDIFAVRVIVETSPENEKIECMKALAIVESIYKRNPERFRNWLYAPKANGYRALHTTVMSKTGKWVEVQIRSRMMDEIAEKGYAAHWKYKEGDTDHENSLDEWLTKIREVLQSPESDALDFLDHFKMNLFSDEIFIFTPAGDMKTLPKSSTALDFAYHIHSNIGNKCIGAKVNHKLVPLSYVLKSGDQVEIITSDKQIPKEEWENFATTAKAISQIKQGIREEKKKQLETGRNKLIVLFEQLNLEFSEKFIEMLRNHLDYPSQHALLLDAAADRIKIKEVKHAMSGKTAWKDYFIRPFTRLLPAGLKSGSENNHTIEIHDDLLTPDETDTEIVQADCCNPIPGDDIIGFRHYNQIIVHRTSCAKAKELSSTYGHKMVKIKWNETNSLSFFVTVKLTGIDKIGIIRDVSKAISEELNVNIRTFHLESKNNVFDGEVKLYISDIKQLKELIKNLGKIEGVKQVFRAE
jgi:GTP diphosphokinase / guanosine-3',5'-bis(diphosphate) 3'-diphosphatase